MSSSAKGATGVSYELKYTASTGMSAGGGVVIDFCHDTPVIGTTCDTTSGDVPSVGSVSLTSVKVNASAPAGGIGSVAGSGSTITWTAGDAYSDGDTVDITFGGITNPANAGTFYARVYTYGTSTSGYQAPDDLGSPDDTGGVALSATDNIGVTAYVAESMLFCVAGSGDDGNTLAPGADCTGATATPSLQLGTPVVGQTLKVLGTTLSTAKDYAQISTNAVHGAVVNLKSNATACGGLFRDNDPANCDIKPQTTTATGIADGSGLFGLTVGAAQSATGASNASGSLHPASGYDDTHYYMDYQTGDNGGVTSTYGSPLFDTSDGTNPAGPVNNKYVDLTFGAAAANTTAAGIYGANLSLIATGTF